MLIINFKNYKTGSAVLKFAKKINDKCIIAAVPSLNIEEVAKNTKLIVYAQHVDNKTTNRATGFLTPKAAKQAGAQGTLLNHSEHPLTLKKIKETIKECKKNKLKVVLCTKNLTQIKELIKLKPFAIAYEEPKLIGTKKSITNHPLKILKFTKLFSKTKIFPLCGAGINSEGDVEDAIKLGCKGILISSAVMKSKNPKSFLKKINI